MSRDALVVGINTYQYLPSLKAPARDAEAIAQRLHTYGEFRVHRLPEVIQAGKPQVGQKTQVTLRELETALINLFKPKGSSIPQTAVFYFSGHGIQREAGIREGYLVLSDSNPEQGFYGLSLFWLRRLLQESPVRQRIIWLDCCHSGELLNFLEADPGAHPGTDRLFMAASREYETAYESLENQYSVFTDALLTGLDPNRIAAGIVTNHSLTDWVNHTLKGEIQQPLFESSGSEIILTRRSTEQASTSYISQPAIQTKDICPYRGLEFFDELHAEYFFGREELTAQLIEKLQKEHFIAITGASGSGKSSLVRAGLIAQLRQGRKVWGSDRWKIKSITPTEHPLKSLAAAFIDPELSDLERAEQLRRAETFLQDGGVGLAQLVRASLPTGSTSLSAEQRPQFLLVIDQFEEVFTLSQGSQAERERQEFFDCLMGALEIIKDLLNVVIVLRADFLSKCSFYEGLTQRISQHQVMVSPLKYEQIKATIVRPAQRVGIVCEPNLVYTMLSDIIGAPGELPLLQYTLAELWRRRRIGTEGGVARLTLDAYQELGGVRGTLQKRATEVFYSLTTEEQNIAKRIFLTLTQLGEGTEDTRRRVVKSELVSPAFPMELVEQVLEKLVAAKLIVISQENRACKDQQVEEEDPKEQQETTCQSSSLGSTSTVSNTSVTYLSQEIVDVTHEALIRNWSLLRGWLDESRDMLRRQRRIEQAAQEWNQAGQPATGEYLLHGLRLRDAEDFLKLYSQELSTLAQQYINVSCAECRRARRASRQLQVAIPSILIATLTVVLSQYYSTIRTQTENEDQLLQATARERAAIAQAVLQDSKADPMAALLISRLAAESKGSGYEAQASLRAALQNLRLQLELQGHKGAVQQIAFSPDRQHLGTAGADGTVRLWAMNAQTIYNTTLKAERVLTWSEDQLQAPAMVQSVAFSPNGQLIAAIAENSPIVKIWSVESGQILHQLVGSATVKQISFSSNGAWIATLNDDRSISVWQAETGALKIRLAQNSVITNLQFSPDSRFLLSAGEDGTAQLWQLGTDAAGSMKLNSVKTLTHPDGVEQAIFSSSGRWIATLCQDGKVRLWSSQTGKLQYLLPAQKLTSANGSTEQEQQSLAETIPPMKQIEFSFDEQTLATIDSNNRVWLWNPQSGQLQVKLDSKDISSNTAQQASNSAGLLKFSPNGQVIVTTAFAPGVEDGFYTAYLWNRTTGQQIGKLFGHQKPISSIQFSPDGTYVATASTDGTVRLWAAGSGGEMPSVQLADGAVASLAFLPSHPVRKVGTPSNPQTATETAAQTTNTSVTNIVTMATDGQLQRWQILTDAADPAIQQVASKTALLSGSYGSAIQSWNDTPTLQGKLSTLTRFQLPGFGDAKTQPLIPGFAQFSQAVPEQAFSSLLASLNLSKQLRIPTANVALSGFALSPDGQMLATADIEGWVTVYRVQADQSRQLLYRVRNWRSTSNATNLASKVVNGAITPQANQNSPEKTNEQVGDPVAIRYLTFSSDSQQFLGIADDLTMRSWDARSGQLLQVFRGHTATIRQARYSADGQWIISASWDRTARIWQTTTGQMVKMLSHDDTVSSASFSLDGQQAITTSWNGTARIWQVSTGKLQLLLNKHQKAVLDAQLSPNGQLLVTASADGTARLWNARTGEEQALLRPNSTGEQAEEILQASFSPDGQYVATLTKRGQVNFWAATEDVLLKLARERSLRQLTSEECNRYLRLSPDHCPQLPS